MLPLVLSRSSLPLASIVVIGALAGSALGCLGPIEYQSRARYPKEATEAGAAPASILRSAHFSRFGEAPPDDEALDSPRLVERLEPLYDRLVLVFGQELDPLSIDPRGFAILRADGRRVRPVRAVLAPASEGDENRSLVLLGNFSAGESPPVAVHVIGSLHAESGESLTGLDASITGPEAADVVVMGEQLAAEEARCPGAAAVVRLYWTDLIVGIEAADLEVIGLGLADGRTLQPSAFDDHEPTDEGGPPGMAPPDPDNVLDLCVAEAAQVVEVRLPAGLFEDEAGHPSAAVRVELTDLPPVSSPIASE